MCRYFKKNDFYVDDEDLKNRQHYESRITPLFMKIWFSVLIDYQLWNLTIKFYDYYKQ